jgi:hypothetical protein
VADFIWAGGGLWHPEADSLAALREDIDENADRWKELLRAPGMRREFLNGVADDDVAVVKAFAHHNRESALKTKPKVLFSVCFCSLSFFFFFFVFAPTVFLCLPCNHSNGLTPYQTAARRPLPAGTRAG